MVKERLLCMNEVINSTLLKSLAQYINYNEAGLIYVKIVIFETFFYYFLIVPPIPNNTVLLTEQRHDTVQTESQK